MPAETLPSALTYKERVALKGVDDASYNRLYNTGQTQTVWNRLHFEATARQTSKALRPTPPKPLFAHGSISSSGCSSLSGFVSNTPTVNVYSVKYAVDVPIETLRPMEQRRFMQRSGMAYFSAIRPEAQTTSQTMRMMGTYSNDYEHAERGQMFIPAGCPGGSPWFHPDVRLTKSADFSRTV